MSSTKFSVKCNDTQQSESLAFSYYYREGGLPKSYHDVYDFDSFVDGALVDFHLEPCIPTDANFDGFKSLFDVNSANAMSSLFDAASETNLNSPLFSFSHTFSAYSSPRPVDSAAQADVQSIVADHPSLCTGPPPNPSGILDSSPFADLPDHAFNSFTGLISSVNAPLEFQNEFHAYNSPIFDHSLSDYIPALSPSSEYTQALSARELLNYDDSFLVESNNSYQQSQIYHYPPSTSIPPPDGPHYDNSDMPMSMLVHNDSGAAEPVDFAAYMNSLMLPPEISILQAISSSPTAADRSFYDRSTIDSTPLPDEHGCSPIDRVYTTDRHPIPSELPELSGALTQQPASPAGISSISVAFSGEDTRRFKCHLCDLAFERFWNLKSHIETHDPNRVRKFICPRSDCPKRFTRKNDMERHFRRVHRGENGETTFLASRTVGAASGSFVRPVQDKERRGEGGRKVGQLR